MNRNRIHYGWVIVGAGVLTIFSCIGLGRFAYGMLLPLMGKSLALRYDQMGFISTGNFAGYLLAVAVAPFFIRRLGGRKTATAGLFLVALSMLFVARGHGFIPILLLYFATGIGTGLSNVPIMVLVSHWFSRHSRGRAAGLMLCGNGAAIVFAGLLIPELNARLGADGWRAGWGILGASSVLVAVAVGLLLRNSPEEMGLAPIGADAGPGGTAASASCPPASGGRRIMIHLGIIYLLFGFTYMIYGTFIVTTLVAERGMAVATAGRFWSWVGLIGLVSGPLFGVLSDRIGRRGGFAAVFAVQTICYALVGLNLGPWSLYLSIVLYGMSAWSIPTIMAAAVGDYLGPARAAVGFSVVTFFFAVGQTAGPGLAGVLARSTGTFAASYLMSAGLTGAAILAAALLRKPGDRGTFAGQADPGATEDASRSALAARSEADGALAD